MQTATEALYASEGPSTFGPAIDRTEVTSPEAARDAIGDLACDREVAVALLLDTRHRLLGRVLVSVGSVDHTFLSPREVFRDAVKAGASAVVVAHSHPSGDCEPSADDVRITRRLVEAGELLAIDLLDHLVIGNEGRWTSLQRRGQV